MNATERERKYYWLLEQPLSPASEGEATDRTRQSITDGDIKQQHTNKLTNKQLNKQTNKQTKENETVRGK